MDYAENTVVPHGNNELNPPIDIDTILAPDPHEEELTRTQKAERTLNRLVPYVTPLVTDTEIAALNPDLSSEEISAARNSLAKELIDTLGWLGVFAPEPATFDEKAFLVASQYNNTRPLEIAVKLGLITQLENGRYLMPSDSKRLLYSLIAE